MFDLNFGIYLSEAFKVLPYVKKRTGFISHKAKADLEDVSLIVVHSHHATGVYIPFLFMSWTMMFR